jgi:hypothetical protein
MDKLGKLFGYVTSIEDLASHQTITKELKLRIINLLSGSSILGIILREQDDSFLVGLPSKLMAYDDLRVVEPYMPVPVIRIFKPTILSLIPVYGEFEIYYIRYILKEGKEVLEDLDFSSNLGPAFENRLKERANHIRLLLEQQLKKKEELAKTGKEETPVEIDSSTMVSATTSKYKH